MTEEQEAVLKETVNKQSRAIKQLVKSNEKLINDNRLLNQKLETLKSRVSLIEFKVNSPPSKNPFSGLGF
jgi:regulator of replication initiation timing